MNINPRTTNLPCSLALREKHPLVFLSDQPSIEQFLIGRGLNALFLYIKQFIPSLEEISIAGHRDG